MASSASTGELDKLLRLWLLADDTLNAMVDGIVLTSHVESADAGSLLKDKPIIIFDSPGGFLHYQAVVQDVNVDVYGYSKRNQAEASTVYETAVTRLQAERITITGVNLVGSMRETRRPVQGFNDQVRGWYACGRFRFIGV